MNYSTCKGCNRPHCKVNVDKLCSKCAEKAKRHREELAKLAQWTGRKTA